MIFRYRSKVRRFARQHGMPEATARMMLAIESGLIDSDVQHADGVPVVRKSPRQIFLDRLASLGRLFGEIRARLRPVSPARSSKLRKTDRSS